MRIKRFDDYSLSEQLIDDFITSITLLTESNEDELAQTILSRYKEKFGDKKPTHQEFADFYHQLRTEGIDGILIFDTLGDFMNQEKNDSDEFVDKTLYQKVEKKVLADLKLDTKLIFTFGAGIAAFYPIVNQMMENCGIESIKLTRETIVLLTLAAITIIFIEEKKYKSTKEQELLIKNSESMLEELRMQGIGDGIVKKIIKSIESIKNLFSIIGRHIGATANGVIDMFAYTSILIPIMNGILSLIGKYDMTMDNVIANFFSIGVGITTRIAKHGLIEILSKLKNRLGLKNKEEILKDLETPSIQNFSTFNDGESDQKGELIKGQ